MINKSLIPNGTPSSNRDAHGNSKGSKIFISSFQKNPYVRALALERDNNSCRCCNGKVTPKFQLHHIDYDNECTLLETISLPHPTFSRPSGKITVPNCQKCHSTRSAAFAECFKRVVVVHGLCNYKIEIARLAQQPEPIADGGEE
jgi:hypothetical protein